MALTTVNSGGIKDDSIVNADIKSDAAIALSKLASTPAVLTGSTNNTITTVTAANTIQGEANLQFDGTGLGIGRAPTAGYLLDIAGTGAPTVKIQDLDGTNQYLDISHNAGESYWVSRNDSTKGTYRWYQHDGSLSTTMLIDSSGRLLTSGQTTSVADSSNLHAHIQSHSADGNALSIGRYSANAYDPYISFFKSRNATIGSNGTIVQDGDTLGTTNYYGATGSAWDHAAYHQVKVDGTPGASNDMPTEFVWYNQADGQQHPAHTMSLRASGDLEVKTGNVVIGTAGKGIDFSAQTTTSTSGATASTSSGDETLDHYEKGIWTPTDYSGAGLTFIYGHRWYIRIGDLVLVNFYITYPSNSDGSLSIIDGLPFAVKANNYFYLTGRVASTTNGVNFQVNAGSTVLEPYIGDTRQTNAQLAGKYMLISGCYQI